MKIVIGSDKYGFNLKETIRIHLEELRHDVTDLGCKNNEDDTPYYKTAVAAAKLISNGEAERSVLICGTGMGMAIIANKFPGVYASVCESLFAAEKCRAVNNSNILTLGEYITAPFIAQEIVDVWLSRKFNEGFNPEIQTFLDRALKDIENIEKSI